MSRRLAVLILVMLIGSAALIAYAGNVHFVGGVSASSGSFVVRGDAAGLGSGSYTFTLNAHGKVTALCQNRGGSIAPGRNPISISSVTSDTFVSDSNGRTSVYLHAPDPSFMSPAPVSPTPKQAGCPNGNWTVIGLQAGSTYWTAATVKATNNANGANALTVSWTCFGTPESCIQN